MIRIIDKSFKRYDEIDSFCRKDPFGVRILSYLTTYGFELDFVDFWYQTDKKDRIVALISGFEDRYTVFSSRTRNRGRLDELKEFIEFRSPSSLMFDFDLRLDFASHKSVQIGDVLKFKKSAASFKNINSDVFVRPDAESYYSILKMNDSEDFKVPEYMFFLSDVTYRKNRNRLAMFGIKDNDDLASVCMTVSECDHAVILGAVATAKDHKGKGYASKLVNSSASLFLLDNKDVYIFSMKESTTRLYKKAGFSKNKNYIEYFFR